RWHFAESRVCLSPISIIFIPMPVGTPCRRRWVRRPIRRGLPKTTRRGGKGLSGGGGAGGQGNPPPPAPPAAPTGKFPGRVGDSPIIGAGTFADNASCAVSATGHGEFFIRFCAASEVAARMRHGGQSLDTAAGGVVAELGHIGGSGGLVAVDCHG